MTLTLRWDPRDLWVGAYWCRPAPGVLREVHARLSRTVLLRADLAVARQP